MVTAKLPAALAALPRPRLVAVEGESIEMAGRDRVKLRDNTGRIITLEMQERFEHYHPLREGDSLAGHCGNTIMHQRSRPAGICSECQEPFRQRRVLIMGPPVEFEPHGFEPDEQRDPDEEKTR